MTKKKATKTNKKYTLEFKEEALKLADRIGVAQTAEKLGIYASQLYSWRSATDRRRTSGEREAILASENARLKRLLAEKSEEFEILKKAATYFAKHQK